MKRNEVSMVVTQESLSMPNMQLMVWNHLMRVSKLERREDSPYFVERQTEWIESTSSWLCRIIWFTNESPELFVFPVTGEKEEKTDE